MLGGQFLDVYNGDVVQRDRPPCRPAGGWSWTHEVASSGCALRVVDLRERRWLKSRGGWVVEGGLLGRLDVQGEWVELYGKRIVRHEPYLEPWPHVWIGNKAWTASHEFFLLRRDTRLNRAVIVRRWTFTDPEASGGYPIVARAHLECQGRCDIVRVHIMHAYDRDLVSDPVTVSSTPRP